MLAKWFGKNSVPETAEDPVERAKVWIRQGNELEDGGNLVEALDLYRRAVDSAPALPAAHLNLGIALMAQGRLDAAEQAYESGLAIDADHPYLLYNYAILEQQRQAWTRVRGLAERAVQHKPDFALAYIALSNALDELGDPVGALSSLDQALQLQAPHAPSYCNRALLLGGLGRWEESEDAARSALAVDSTYGQALDALGLALWKQGFTQESLAYQEAAMQAMPERRDLVSRHLFAQGFLEATSVSPLYEAHQSFGKRLEAMNPPRFASSYRGALDPDRKLRVGLLSGDLRAHPITVFLKPLLEQANRDELAFYAYSVGKDQDQVTDAIRSLMDHWVDLANADEIAVANAIHSDGIDVLIDLSGHTSEARLGTLATAPAPIQIGWIGYLNTTGLSRVKYRLCDARTDPLETSKFHTEQLLHMPHSQWCYAPAFKGALVDAPPCLRNGFITFGSFNTAGKITPEMTARWACLLGALPTARLLIADVRGERKKTAVLAALHEHGVVPSRVTFVPRVGLEEYFSLFNQVDIALDTYPYGGATTTFDALWMGVPVVTAVGELPMSRSAASLLQALDMNEWIAPCVDQYVEVALARALDVSAMAQGRALLRQRLRDSPLMDASTFARDFEACLRTAWRTYCAQAQIPPLPATPTGWRVAPS